MLVNRAQRTLTDLVQMPIVVLPAHLEQILNNRLVKHQKMPVVCDILNIDSKSMCLKSVENENINSSKEM